MKLSRAQIYDFQETLWTFYAANARSMPWREPEANGAFDPYRILVSELMLQQTQVSRVVPKFEAFVSAFPTFQALAQAPLGEVLQYWNGLGYNRRARYLHEAAKVIVDEYDGSVPEDKALLMKLPGIGKNTAAAIMVYACNLPEQFIETNVRTVYIHHFFHDQDGVTDRAIMELLEQTLDAEQPREFYWALMDYGTHLKATVGNRSRQSHHYKKQSAFKGSVRQVRGEVLRQLLSGPKTSSALATAIADERLDDVLASLEKEELIVQNGKAWQLP